MQRCRAIIVMALFLCILPAYDGHIFAQDKTTSNADIESLRVQVNLLRHDLDSLRSIGSAVDTSDQTDQLDQMEERIEKKLSMLEGKIDALSRGMAPIAFNPRTVAFINFAARHDNTIVRDLADSTNQIQNRPFLRSAELELSAPVDPYVSAVLIATLENKAGQEFGVDAEEAYGLIKKVPILEEAPLGLKIKLGKFRPAIGLNNKIHMHDLPWTTRPLAVASFLGTEHGDFFEGGYAGVGADFDFYVPSIVPGTTMEMNLDVLRGGNIAVASLQNDRQPAYLGHLSLAKDWDNVSLLNFGLSTYQEGGAIPAAIYGADVTYKWSPAEERESNSVVAGAEGFIVDARDPVAPLIAVHPEGWFTYMQYQVSYWLYLGGRYDWTQELSQSRAATRAMSLYASYYTTEFFRFRFGFEHRESEQPWQNNVNSILFDANIVFGSHPTEPYWVNR